MKIHNSWPPLKRIFCLMALLLPWMGGCSGVKNVEWTEDVKLSSGHQILVRRMTEFRSVMDVGAGFQRGYLFDHASISAELPAPASRKVEWAGRGLSPFILDLLPDGRVYLVCKLGSAEGANIWKVPQHEYFVSFRLKGDQWERVPLADLPPAIRRTNLLGSVDTVFMDLPGRTPKHFDFKMKDALAAQYGREPRDQAVEIYPPRSTR